MNLKKLGQNYINFLTDFGLNDHMELDSFKNIFSESCRKIINGNIACNNIHELKTQLEQVKSATEDWNIKPNNIIQSDNAEICVVQYELHSANLGNFITIAILGYNNGLIEEINEVYNQK
ncbi:MAG: hypothetical protein ACK4OM_01490 [Alphaproteobacteria bacterium]